MDPVKFVRAGAIMAFVLAMGTVALAVPAEKTEVKENPEFNAAAETQSGRDQALAKRRERIVSESVAALEATNRALEALDKGDAEGALADLEIASGKLDLLVSRYPDSAMFLPVDISFTQTDIAGPDEEIEAIVEAAKEALDKGRVQLARTLLMPLASELVFSTRELPLAAYPAAMRLAAPLIDQGKLDEARNALQAALDTMVIRKEVIPLPVLRAELLLAAAERQLKTPVPEEGTSASTDESVSPATLLAAARHQLERASLLGYGDAKRTYPDLVKRIEKLEKGISPEPTSGWKARMGKLRKALAEVGSELMQ